MYKTMSRDHTADNVTCFKIHSSNSFLLLSWTQEVFSQTCLLRKVTLCDKKTYSCCTDTGLTELSWTISMYVV